MAETAALWADLLQPAVALPLGADAHKHILDRTETITYQLPDSAANELHWIK
jgi:hypothetical protein